MKKSFDFVLLTPVDIDEKDTSKASIALICFALAIVMSLAGFPISISFLSGAIAMILMRVLPMDEAYQAVDWKVIFFIAGLIPLGLAMQNTGAAALLASNIISLVGGSGIIVILLVISIITTLFSLFMSNVGAAVILFPIVISIAPAAGIDPRPLVLLVAVSAANSFFYSPTHQVKRLVENIGRLQYSDYVRAGWGLTFYSYWHNSIFLPVI